MYTNSLPGPMAMDLSDVKLTVQYNTCSSVGVFSKLLWITMYKAFSYDK